MLEQSLNNQIIEYRKLGYSANKIAKTIHKRKQDVLNRIRQIENTAKKPVNFIGFHKVPIEQHKVDAFIDAMYIDGYPQYLIDKIVHLKYPDATHYYIKNRIKTENAENKENRKIVIKDIRKKGKEYVKNRNNGKFYYETNSGKYGKEYWATYHEEEIEEW